MFLSELTQKPLYTVQPSDTVSTAARLMCEHSVGALIVTDASGATPLGIITDRDLVWMIAEGLDPRVAVVGQFVQAPLYTAEITDGPFEIVRKLREHGVRRLPIVDREARLVGVVSMDDVLQLFGRALGDVAATIAGELTQEQRIGAARHPTGHAES